MKVLIIRHGDPDYTVDSLTERGWREAGLLAERIAALDVKAFYVSPLGRARATASITLKKMNREAEILPWLREFQALVPDPATGEMDCPWDFCPADWTPVDSYYDKDLWHTVPRMQSGNVLDEARWVYRGLDALLEKHGYRREGELYKAVAPNNDLVVLFCHFGVECVMLGHLLGISPVVLWHGTCAAPTSVTVLASEERQKGNACFRMNAFGDTSHLYAAGEKPSFSARFCETYENRDERH